MARLRASRWVAPTAGVGSLLAAALVTAALFPTFVSQACSGCSAFVTAGLPSAALRDSPDAWAAVWIAGGLASTAILFLTGVASRLIAIANALASLAAVGLAFFDGAVAFPRVLGAAELVPGVPVSYVLGSGFYLFLIGGVVAVGSAGLMLRIGVAETEIGHLAPAQPGVIAAAAWACLASLVAAVVGAFLPFAALNCGFGCPPVQPPAVSFSGAIVGSSDGRIVLVLLVAAAISTAVRVTGRRKLLVSVTALLLTFALTVLVSFESLNAATRVLGWAYPVPTSPALGYYLLQVGAAIAALLSVVLVAIDRRGSRLRRRIGVRTREAAHPA